ncbi:TPA: hypothetical protein ACSP1Y_004184 [Aeromonas hydrophila]
MTLTLNPAQIACDTFGNLETFDSQWLTQYEHWEGFMEAFFESNGLEYSREYDSRVKECIEAEDKSAFSSMIDVLLPRLAGTTAFDDVNTVLMAHWTPDLHLGTSVVNHAIHSLNLSSDCFGLAISDRGLSAPLFALECLQRNLGHLNQSALLLVADQKNLLYKSELMNRLSPFNSACVIKLDINGTGWRYQGYRKVPRVSSAQIAESVSRLKDELGLPSDTPVIGAKECLDGLPPSDRHIAINPRLLCSAPFFALQQQGSTDHDYLLIVHEQNILYAVGLLHREAPCA